MQSKYLYFSEINSKKNSPAQCEEFFLSVKLEALMLFIFPKLLNAQLHIRDRT